jgi:CBS domain containing-hemolysin-like protein
LFPSIDEFGGTAGIVTKRDLAGAIVGRLETEYVPGHPSASAVNAQDQGVAFDGRMRLDEFQELTGVTLSKRIDAHGRDSWRTCNGSSRQNP